MCAISSSSSMRKCRTSWSSQSITPGASWSEYFCWKILRPMSAAGDEADDDERDPLAARLPPRAPPAPGATLLERCDENMRV